MRTGKMSWWAVVLGVSICLPAFGASKEPAPPAVGPALQAVSVNIKASGSPYSEGTQGSGTIVLVPRKGENRSAWILTAAHVVDGLREIKAVIGSDGEERKRVSYKDAQIVQEVPDNTGSRVVGDTRLDAKVVCVDETRDIALLRVRALGKLDHSVTFYLDDTIPPVGTEIYHSGAPGGQQLGGTCTLTSGIVSRTGVRIEDFGGSEHGIYDQTDTAALGGSSGGLIALKQDGRFVGMLTLGIGSGADSFHWFVPVRSVREWAKEAGVEWLLEEDGKMPSEDEINKIPLEHNPNGVKKEDATPTKPKLLPDIQIDMPIQRPNRMLAITPAIH